METLEQTKDRNIRLTLFDFLKHTCIYIKKGDLLVSFYALNKYTFTPLSLTSK